MTDYLVYQSEYIAKKYLELITDLDVAHDQFKKMFPDNNSTWSYSAYNVFSLTAPSSGWYEIYKELRTVIRKELGYDRPLWLQAWINYHKQDEVLDWHEHEFEFHGYISIDPKKTKTIFPDYEIINKPGQIYFGPGYRQHKVEILEPFEGNRITVGYDVHTTPVSKVYEYYEKPFMNMSLVPLI